MGIGFTLLLIVHIVICLLMILLVTLQNDKGGGLAGAFGGGSSAFTGSSAVTILTKITQVLGIASFVVLLGLSYFSARASQSFLGESELKKSSNALSGALPQQAPAGLPGAVTGEP
jgi:preprotein translocase subunit SecG